MEYSPTEELGFVEEKQLILSCNGILSKNDYARNLCARFIRNGERVFDVISRYEDIITYALTRDPEVQFPTMKMIVPFLKAYGLTDNAAYTFAKENLEIMPGSKNMVSYVRKLIPTYVITGSLEHHMMALCEDVDMPFDRVSCTNVEFDKAEMDKQEGRAIREVANKIANLRIPKTMYTMTDAKFLDDDDAKIVTELDKLFQETLPAMKIWEDYKDVVAISANEKAYALLEVRKKNEIDFGSTVYVGNGINDHQSLDLIRDSDGLAISFNGDEYAVRGSNIMVLSNDVSIIGLLTAEFYDQGIEKIYDLAENWDRKKLEEGEFADRNLVDNILMTYPRKLPVVKRVTRKNIKECVLESEQYRKKVFR